MEKSIDSNKSDNNQQIICEYCDQQVARKNISRHKNDYCMVKRVFNIPKREILRLISGECDICKVKGEEISYWRGKYEKEREEKLAVVKENIKLKTDLSFYIEINNIKGEEAEQTILSMGIKPRTKREYEAEWKRYFEWARKEKKPLLSPSTAGEYIKTAKSRRTAIKKRNQIQSILRKVTKKAVLIDKPTQALIPRKKFFLSELDLKEHLEKQKMKDREIYLAEYIQSHLGLRINAVANLRTEHMNFLNNPNSNQIMIPEAKTGYYIRSIDMDLINEVRNYLKQKNITFGFVFETGNTNDHNKRAALLGRKVNRNLKMSFGEFTSHDLRRTFAQIEYESGFKRICMDVSTKLNHKNINVTKTHYLKCELPSVEPIKIPSVFFYDHECNVSKIYPLDKDNNGMTVYSQSFSKADELEPSLKECKHFGFFVGENQIGAISFRLIKICDMNIADVIMLGTLPGHQGRGIGTELINFVRRNFSRKIFLWADIKSIGFYKSLGFTQQIKIGYNIQKHCGVFIDSTPYATGFKKKELELLRKV